MDKARHTVEAPHTSQEKKHVPRAGQLARANVLALYWDKPVSSLTENGQALPGIQGRFLPEDREQTLGSFLSEGDTQIPTFDAFKQQLDSGDKDKVRKVVNGFKTLCPSPEELFAQNPNLLNWVPWETFIAYGDVLQSQRSGANDENVAAVVSGSIYLDELREKFPKGSPRKRTEIVLERQNKDPKSQGILESVSNSIDAISEREKIGQFGLGVKQIFAWLEKGKGEVQVTSKIADGKLLALQARKGYDDQLYIKFSEPSADEVAQFADGKTGTHIKLTDITVDATKQSDLTDKLHDRFRYVPETTITVNDIAINGHDRVKVVGRETPVVPKGKIDVTLKDTEIVIKDSGAGMDEQTLFKMFLPGYGKGYNALSSSEAMNLAHTQAEVLLVEEAMPRIVFSRNREADFVIDIPKDRLNTSSKTICLELGRIIKVSEGRDGFEIDENFAAAVPILVEKTLNDTTITDSEKTTFLNSLTLGIDQLSGNTKQDSGDKIATIVKKTKKGIRDSALPYLKQLRSKDITLLPNFTSYQKIKTEAQFVDPYLLEGLGDIATVLQEEGIKRLKGTEGITTKEGWKVFTTDLEQTPESQQLQSKDEVRETRAQLSEVLPVILDKEHRIVIVDQALWQKIDHEQDPIRRAYLQESIQALINEKVQTGYEASAPRAIFVQDEQKMNNETTGEILLSRDESEVFRKSVHPIMWSHENILYQIDSSGVMKRYDKATKQFLDSALVKELEGKEMRLSQTTDQGVWILQDKGVLVQINHEGAIVETHQIPQIAGFGEYTFRDLVSIAHDGRVVFASGSEIHIFNPRTQQDDIYETSGPAKPEKPFLTSDNRLVFMQAEKINVVDRTTGDIASSSENIFQIDNENYKNSRHFFTHKNRLYAIAFIEEARAMGLFEITQKNQEITTDKVFSKLGKWDLGSVNVITEPDDETVGIKLSNKVTFFHPNPLQTENNHTIKFPNDWLRPAVVYAANTLKDLFGDERDSSYSEALLALRERLRNNMIRIDTAPFLSKINKVRGKEMPKNKTYGEEILMHHEYEKRIEEKYPEELSLDKEIRRPEDKPAEALYLDKKIQRHLPDERISNNEIKMSSIHLIRNSTPPETLWIDEMGVSHSSSAPIFPSLPKGTVITDQLTDERTKQFIGVFSSEQLKAVFSPVWESLNESGDTEDRERLKMRFVRNSPLLLDFPGQAPTPEIMQLFFFSDNPQIFFDQSEMQQQKIVGMLNGIDNLSQKEGFIKLATFLTKGKTPAELDTYYNQLDKLFTKDQFRDAFLQAIDQNTTELQKAALAPSELEIANPLRSYLLFITNESDLLRTKEQLATTDGYEDVLPQNIPVELLAYFRLADGLVNTDEISERIAQEGGVETIMEKINLSHYQDEIRKAIHAQSVEPGVAKRELLQNALYAIRKSGNGGAINVDFYLRDNGQELVEEIKDNGTGIENLISFLVPGVTTKGAADGLGIFGTGFYKTLENVDHIEVDSVKKGDSQNQAERIIIDLIKDDEGRVQGGVVREIKAKTVSGLVETGATIKLVQKTEDHLPELEAMIAKNTYLTMGGLATVPQIAGMDTEFSFIDDSGHAQPVTIPIVDSSTLPLEKGNLTFVKAPSLPPAMTSLGLRMSSLVNVSSDYLHDVPESLKTFLADERISVVLPKEVPLVKDRSRIANEESYLPAIQQAIATETIKRAAYALLNDSTVNVRGLIPEDILTNQNYYKTLTSELGTKANAIAQKINNGRLLETEDLTYLNQEGNTNELLLVLIGIEQEAQDGKKDSLLRRFQYIQEKAGNTTISSAITLSLGFDATQTAVSPQLVRDEQRLVPQTQQNTASSIKISAVNIAIDQNKKPEGVTSLAETNMNAKEKTVLLRYFSGLGFDEVYFVPHEQIGAEGSCNGRRLFLNTGILELNPRARWEVINHESSHLLEKRALGIADGVLDTDSDKRSSFTHQQEGSFADYYKVAANAMRLQLG